MTLLLTLVIVLLVAGALSIGLLAGRGPIKGSCGGMAALGMGKVCDICGGDRTRCDATTEPEAGAPKAPKDAVGIYRPNP
jgi:uncharacterized protein